MIRPTPLRILLCALALAACATDPAEESPAGTASAPPAPAVSEPAAGDLASAGPSAPATGGAPSVDGPATIATGETEGYGTVLTDGAGLTVYLFLEDTGGQSTCYDACADNWPPVLTGGAPAADGDADDALLGTVERDDGTTQVTYDGQPLYLFSADTAPGDVLGFGSGDVWYPLSPDGAAIDVAPARSEPTGEGGY